MKKNLRLISAFLLGASALAALSACGSGTASQAEGNNAPIGSEAAAETEAPDMLDARKSVSDGLPEKDYGGKEFRVLTYDYVKADFVTDGGETGALINDVTYRRNRDVEDRFHVTLKADGDKGLGDVSSMIKRAVTAGEDAFDLISQHMIETANIAVSGMYLDWGEIPYVDPQKPWWNQSAYENLSINGKSYLLTGAISPAGLGGYYCVYMNKRLGADYDLNESIYQTVLDGKFTIDVYRSLIKDVYKDINGNGTVDEGDQFGLAAQVTSYATPFAYAFGEITVKHDKDGMPYLDMDADKWSAMVEKVYDLFYGGNDTITTDGWSLHSDTFLDSRALFMNGVFLHSYQRFTDFKDDYAILPYPKWNEAQAEYYTMTDGSSPLASIPVTCGDVEYAGIITEALAAEAWKTIIPTVYDVALKVRGARDETSMTVIDIIERGCVFDFGFVFSGNNGMGATFSSLMGSKKKDFASYYEKNKKSWDKKIQNVIDSYNES